MFYKKYKDVHLEFNSEWEKILIEKQTDDNGEDSKENNTEEKEQKKI